MRLSTVQGPARRGTRSPVRSASPSSWSAHPSRELGKVQEVAAMCGSKFLFGLGGDSNDFDVRLVGKLRLSSEASVDGAGGVGIALLADQFPRRPVVDEKKVGHY